MNIRHPSSQKLAHNGWRRICLDSFSTSTSKMTPTMNRLPETTAGNAWDDWLDDLDAQRTPSPRTTDTRRCRLHDTCLTKSSNGQRTMIWRVLCLHSCRRTSAGHFWSILAPFCSAWLPEQTCRSIPRGSPLGSFNLNVRPSPIRQQLDILPTTNWVKTVNNCDVTYVADQTQTWTWTWTVELKV